MCKKILNGCTLMFILAFLISSNIKSPENFLNLRKGKYFSNSVCRIHMHCLLEDIIVSRLYLLDNLLSITPCFKCETSQIRSVNATKCHWRDGPESEEGC